jgi:tRNA A-37 threonylcarbamoyl transferase component Bud32
MATSDYITLRNASASLLAVRGLTAPPLDQFLQDPAGELLRNLDEPVKLSHDSLIVVARWSVSAKPLPVALKQYRARNGWKAFCGLFRRSRATLAWQRAQTLLAHGIATPRPIAAWSPRAWRTRAVSYLATEWIEGAENLHLYGWRLASRPANERLRPAALAAESLGRLIGRMHAAGFSHRDLKGANLLLADRGDLAAAWLVDLDGVQARRHVAPKTRAANLARLAAGLNAHPWVTRTICLRFLRAYVGQFPKGVVAWKLLWRDVAARSRAIAKRKRRRGGQVL